MWRSVSRPPDCRIDVENLVAALVLDHVLHKTNACVRFLVRRATGSVEVGLPFKQKGKLLELLQVQLLGELHALLADINRLVAVLLFILIK